MDYFFLFISLRCNNECRHCLYGCKKEKGENMSFEVFKDSIRIAISNNIKKLNFFGGEPFMNPLIFEMISYVLNFNFTIQINTNCRILYSSKYFDKFVAIVGNHKKNVIIRTSRDKYHLEKFDPLPVIAKLSNLGFETRINTYCDDSVLLSPNNIDKLDSYTNTDFSCCGKTGNPSPAILPDGSWTLCVASLIPFTNIYSLTYTDLLSFTSTLNIQSSISCTECLKKFPEYRKSLDKWPEKDKS
jgi:hypothetical protein